MKHARTIYLPIYDQTTGDIGSLEVDKTHIDEPRDLSIDTLVLGITPEEAIDEDIHWVENI